MYFNIELPVVRQSGGAPKRGEKKIRPFNARPIDREAPGLRAARLANLAIHFRSFPREPVLGVDFFRPPTILTMHPGGRFAGT